MPALFHVVALLGVTAIFVTERVAPARYEALVQEDRVVEWWTVALFAVAAVLRLRRAAAARRAFDLLVGLFCLFVAGEEISWGQRLLGFTPPESFLEKNTQQELTIHNFAGIFGRPKWSLIAALAGFGVLLPAIAASSRGRRALDRIGATAPAAALVPWFLVAVGLLVWYPLEFTGEWVELLAGSLFVVSLPLRGVAVLAVAAATLAAAVVMTRLSASRWIGDPRRLACADAEASALLRDLTMGGAATERMWAVGSLHKRAWTAAGDGYLDWSAVGAFRSASCDGAAAADAERRREFGIDPWGTAYWIRVGRANETGREVIVYSFGPNRRRDDGGNGDDIVVRTLRR